MTGTTKMFIDNLDYLRDLYKLRQGDIEKICGVSVGYFSRTRKANDEAIQKGKEIQIGMPVIVNVVNHFHISLDTLFFVPLRSLNKTEKYLASFLEKSALKTREHKMVWENAPEPELQYWGATKGKQSKVQKFNSHAFEENTSIAGDCYRAVMPNDAYVYVVKVGNVRRQDKTAVEVWFFMNGEREYVCGTKDSSSLAHLVEKLYNDVNYMMKKPALNLKVMESIDDFMQD